MGVNLRQAMLAWLGLAVFTLNGCGHDPAAVDVVRMGLKGSSVGTATVQEGDSISMLAQRYDLPLESLIAANNLTPPYYIYPNQRLTLPPPKTYRVRRGDTLYDISRLFSTTQTRIVRLNNIQKPYHISAGQVLRMPMPEQALAYAPQPQSVRRMKNNPLADIPEFSGNGRFALPVKGNVISAYGPKEGGLHNDGINIAAPRGATIGAAQDGVVAYVGDAIEGYGNLVLIRHDKGFVTAYAHLDNVHVTRGQQVRRMDSIGTVGSTGNVGQPQLHFEIRQGVKAHNPAAYL